MQTRAAASGKKISTFHQSRRWHYKTEHTHHHHRHRRRRRCPTYARTIFPPAGQPLPRTPTPASARSIATMLRRRRRRANPFETSSPQVRPPSSCAPASGGGGRFVVVGRGGAHKTFAPPGISYPSYIHGPPDQHPHVGSARRRVLIERTATCRAAAASGGRGDSRIVGMLFFFRLVCRTRRIYAGERLLANVGRGRGWVLARAFRQRGRRRGGCDQDSL
jgi:hypothetical protein